MKIEGLDSLLKKLDKLGVNAEKELFKTVSKQGEFVKGQAKMLCTVQTGSLRQSIRKETKKNKDKIVCKIYTNLEYAPYVEFGTGKVGERTNRNTDVPLAYKQDKWLVNIPDVGVRWTEGQPAQPFLYPALKNNTDKIIESIKNDLKRAIREVT